MSEDPIEDLTTKRPKPEDVDTFMDDLQYRLKTGADAMPPNKAKALAWAVTHFRVWGQSHRYADLNNAITVNPALLPADFARYLLAQTLPHANELPAFSAFAAAVYGLPTEPLEQETPKEQGP